VRPQSVTTFERLYLASLALVVVQQVVGYFVARDLLATMPGVSANNEMQAFQGLMLGAGVVGGLLMAVGIPLLLAWLAARKRQEVAKWLLLVLSVLSVLSWCASLMMLAIGLVPAMPGGVTALQGLAIAFDGLAELLGIAALWFLFRPDATAWFRSRHPHGGPDVFR
jgi:hypothetical protein